MNPMNTMQGWGAIAEESQGHVGPEQHTMHDEAMPMGMLDNPGALWCLSVPCPLPTLHSAHSVPSWPPCSSLQCR